MQDRRVLLDVAPPQDAEHHVGCSRAALPRLPASRATSIPADRAPCQASSIVLCLQQRRSCGTSSVQLAPVTHTADGVSTPARIPQGL